ncbi:MAG: type II CAAX endopeptidase family protein [Cyanobacteria bacterium P01_F01_bin.33]
MGVDRSAGERWADWLRRQQFWVRLPVFLGCVLVLGCPALILDRWSLLGEASDGVALAILYVALGTVIRWWGRCVRQQSRAFAYWGLTGTNGFYRDLGLGSAIALGTLFCLFGLEAWAGWLSWQSVAFSELVVTCAYAISLGLGVAAIEELLFRGWLLRELYEDYPFSWAAAGSSVVYALVHAWGPQILGLFMLGMVLVRARWLRGELGLAIGLHAGWVAGIATVNLLNWIDYGPTAPAWAIGLDGNPLAGVLGVVLLGLTGLTLSGLPPHCASE